MTRMPVRITARRVHRIVLAVLLTLMLGELVLSMIAGQWLTAALVLAIAFITVAPVVLKDRMPVAIPAEFQVLAIVFVFASLFLGEIRGYYQKLWWWDVALHTFSGLLLGIVGFLLVYVLNENERLDLSMKPRFVAGFALAFAVTMGAFWEIFEFAMDRTFGLQMQKPMFGDPSGLTDTMWDLIVDTLGALAIALYGGYYLQARRSSFVEAWITKFIRANPRLFRHEADDGTA